jgi:hypothetical protein
MTTSVDMGGDDLHVNSLSIGASAPGVAGTSISSSELTVLDSVTAGTVSASKAVVVDSSKNITGFNNITTTGTLTTGANATDKVAVKGIYMSPANVVVAVPSITDPDSASVDVDVSAAFSMQPAVGDAVIAMPQEALPSNCFLSSAYVTATDTVTLMFTSIGGNVTGANKNFKFLVVDVT